MVIEVAAGELLQASAINLAEPRQDRRVLKLATGAGKRQSASMFERERASPAFDYDWTKELTTFAWPQVAFRIPIECDDDMRGRLQFQAGFKLSAEDLQVGLSATTSYAIFALQLGDACPPFDRADMDESVRATGVRLNKPKPFPLH